MIISVFKVWVGQGKVGAQQKVAKEVGEGPYHVLRNSLIAILALDDESNIARVLDAFSRKELRSFPHLEEPQ